MLGPTQPATVVTKKKSPFAGVWRIIAMEQWDRDYIDLDGPGFIKFERGDSGAMRFGAVEIDLDCSSDATAERIEFSFEGHNDADPCSGRGWAEIRNGQLCGMIFIHGGDKSWFEAIRP
jgi:hypothetical protein